MRLEAQSGASAGLPMRAAQIRPEHVFTEAWRLCSIGGKLVLAGPAAELSRYFRQPPWGAVFGVVEGGKQEHVLLPLVKIHRGPIGAPYTAIVVYMKPPERQEVPVGLVRFMRDARVRVLPPFTEKS